MTAAISPIFVGLLVIFVSFLFITVNFHVFIIVCVSSFVFGFALFFALFFAFFFVLVLIFLLILFGLARLFVTIIGELLVLRGLCWSKTLARYLGLYIPFGLDQDNSTADWDGFLPLKNIGLCDA